MLMAGMAASKPQYWPATPRDKDLLFQLGATQQNPYVKDVRMRYADDHRSATVFEAVARLLDR
ncbi:hypothetical protein PRtIB026_A23590 [Pseudomonas sp. RtIB026]|jgi:hypothetical protein|nr:hypothetical protein PRtIB026_A23590 [Pseudomonas sp. RtIB026]